uniref:Helix-turn-helix DNA binding domain protein n=2 Tax=unclassified bacterial viruses TaxID=12333 RepID=A0AAU7J7I4_9VIRU
MVREMVDLPEWMDDVIRSRAKAMGVSYEQALVSSLDIGSTDLLAESAGWAVDHIGERVAVVARRMAYSRSSIDQAVRRYRER